ncbi:MAG: phosphomannomutase [Polyangiaceae bacterium]
MTTLQQPPSFLKYVPNALAFGTSGLRGLVTDITDLETYINIKGALAYLFAIGDTQPGAGVVLAEDLRPSSDRIMRACARAIEDSRCSVENAGKVPTPALVLRSMKKKECGVMVSGSHIPFDRNGIKINKSVGEVLKSDEEGIVREVTRVRAEEYAKSAKDSIFDENGMLKDTPELPLVNASAQDEYVARYVNAFPHGLLKKKRIVVYQHSAVGRDLLPKILESLGAEVVTCGKSDVFIPVDTENITNEELALLERYVTEAETSGGAVDALVSTDGDSDRPLVIAVLPKGTTPRVRFLPGDLLGVIAAGYLKADAASVPISTNDAVEKRASDIGMAIEKTRIGSPFVVASIENQRRNKAFSRVVGWEANGGFLVGSEIKLDGGMLAPLPSRDSTLPILANFGAAIRAKISLAKLWDALPKRFGRAGLIDNFPVATSRAIVAALTPAGGKIESEVSTDLADLLARFFTKADGFGRPLKINVLDGVRIWFDNGDVAHIRPSGNAPQLRIYANADSQERADKIVQLGLREPDGILRALENAFK